jgi:hypothetical protein
MGWSERLGRPELLGVLLLVAGADDEEEVATDGNRSASEGRPELGPAAGTSNAGSTASGGPSDGSGGGGGGTGRRGPGAGEAEEPNGLARTGRLGRPRSDGPGLGAGAGELELEARERWGGRAAFRDGVGAGDGAEEEGLEEEGSGDASTGRLGLPRSERGCPPSEAGVPTPDEAEVEVAVGKRPARTGLEGRDAEPGDGPATAGDGRVDGGGGGWRRTSGRPWASTQPTSPAWST